MRKFAHFFTNALPFWAILASIFAYNWPISFLGFKDTIQWWFALTMLGIGTVLHPEDFLRVVQKPAPIFFGTLIQYTVMPMLGLAAAIFSGLPKEIAVGFVLVGCAPGAMASNVMTYLARGDVPYSVSLTTLSTVLAPIVTPFLVLKLGGIFVPVEFWPLFKTILWTVVIPLFTGFAIRLRFPQYISFFEAFSPAFAVLAIVVICGYVVAANAAQLAHLSAWIASLVVAVNVLGYIGGYLAAKFARMNTARRATLAIEIGMQNAGLGVVLALKHFSPDSALPSALFAIWAIVSASVYVRVVKARLHSANPKVS
jgi:BASS family bile acid:Na+ symporter